MRLFRFGGNRHRRGQATVELIMFTVVIINLALIIMQFHEFFKGSNEAFQDARNNARQRVADLGGGRYDPLIVGRGHRSVSVFRGVQFVWGPTIEVDRSCIMAGGTEFPNEMPLHPLP